jgi:hypothetical protein
MAMFVRSELSAGVQLADMCSYAIYLAFKSADLAYPFFQRIAPSIWTTHERVRAGRPFSGIAVLDGPGSPLVTLVETFEKEQALARKG